MSIIGKKEKIKIKSKRCISTKVQKKNVKKERGVRVSTKDISPLVIRRQYLGLES